VALLDVRDLRVSFETDDGTVHAVQGMSFSVEPGQTLGIVGESGSGKSVCTQAIMGLTPGATVTGEARLNGADLLAMGERELERIRGSQVSLIFQDPLTSLHPLYRVGRQIAEVMTAHGKTTRQKATARAVELLGLVGIPQPDRRARDYPHQFSGGMRQRVMIAMALALEPALIIADEPTTALDVTVQAQILELLKRMQEDFRTAVILITRGSRLHRAPPPLHPGPLAIDPLLFGSDRSSAPHQGLPAVGHADDRTMPLCQSVPARPERLSGGTAAYEASRQPAGPHLRLHPAGRSSRHRRRIGATGNGAAGRHDCHPALVT
jgi:ABC-type dipeptide/oligopeptide/nickel transport system ATPase subunit